MLQQVSCNYCSRDAVTVVSEAGVAQKHRIVQCTHCGLMYASPRRTEHEHFDEPVDAAIDISNPYTLQRLKKEKVQVGDYASTRALLAALLPERGKLLEVGAGFGYLLAEFRKDGWDVRGLDPYQAACNFVRDTHKIEVINGVLENASIPYAAYDVVIMNHVIEHVRDPLQSLRDIHRILKPGGYLVIETPRYDSLMFKLLGRRERSISCNDHIYFFTTKSLKNIYGAAGFATVNVRYTGRTLTLDRFMWNLGVVSKSTRVQAALNAISRVLSLEKISLHLNLRDIQRVVVQKV